LNSKTQGMFTLNLEKVAKSKVFWCVKHIKAKIGASYKTLSLNIVL